MSRRHGARVLGPLVVDGTDAALASAFALIGTVRDSEKCDSDHGKDCEENEGHHQVLPGPGPLQSLHTVPAKLFWYVGCRWRVCSRLKA